MNLSFERPLADAYARRWGQRAASRARANMPKKVPDRLAVMAFDPGGTTGVAWGVMKVEDTLAATLQGAALASADITGKYQQQAGKLLDLWNGLSFHWIVEQQIPDDCVHLVSEGFTLRKMGSSAKVGLYPVWISAMFEGMLWASGRRLVYQDPSQQSFATSARLKRWGAWERGVSPHRRSAMKHLVKRVNLLI